MPTNLAALPSDKPVPNGKVQIKRGLVDGSVVVNSGNYGKIQDGAGGFLQISYTPLYPCLWVINDNIMYHGVADGQGWRRVDHSIMISPADADGRTSGYQCPIQVYDQTTVEWRTVAATATFRLNAGIAYTAYMNHTYIEKGSARYHTGPMWVRIIGRIVGEGVM